jgi:hypothetical protein
MGLTPAPGLPRPRARAFGRLLCRKRYATVRAAAGESADASEASEEIEKRGIIYVQY